MPDSPWTDAEFVPLTPETALERVAAIERIAHDPEGAHSAEDDLHFDALATIAAGCENPAELAQIALRTDAIEFERWYA